MTPACAPPVIAWFRRDLRIADNPALAAAARTGPVIPVYVHAPADESPWSPGAASDWWLHHSLAALTADLARLGAPLLLRRGPAAAVLADLVRTTGAVAIHFSRRFEPGAVAQEAAVRRALEPLGVAVYAHISNLLHDPSTLRTTTGGPYRVFTPFWRALAASAIAPPEPDPRRLHAAAPQLSSEPLDSLTLLPSRDWANEFSPHWQPGEKSATRRLAAFLGAPAADYPSARDRPDLEGTASLSPHLHFGEIGPRACWHFARAAAAADPQSAAGIEAWLRQLTWREFAHHLLHHFPHTTDSPLRPEFERFPWQPDPAHLRAWQRGGTGYPIVDAGMRQLWRTGWMHNRVRMIAASFLVKDLLQPWQEGARWFWETLLDADLANNTLGWQWVAGCGADAAPFFRIFNPVTQGTKFDPDGAYIRRWVPELARLSTRFIHAPWQAPPAECAAAGIALDQTYPAPIVDHARAREAALDAHARLTART